MFNLRYAQKDTSEKIWRFENGKECMHVKEPPWQLEQTGHISILLTSLHFNGHTLRFHPLCQPSLSIQIYRSFCCVFILHFIKQVYTYLSQIQLNHTLWFINSPPFARLQTFYFFLLMSANKWFWAFLLWQTFFSGVSFPPLKIMPGSSLIQCTSDFFKYEATI